MKKTIITLLAAVICAAGPQQAKAEGLTDNLTYNFRLGYMVGGTAPVGMPATIRSLDSYRLQPNMTLGIDVNKSFGTRWGISTGLRLENKGMNIDATVKNYHTAFVKGDQRVEGYFTGHNHSEVEEWMFTLPLLATYAITPDLHIKAGCYASVLTSRKFEGYAYDGYLREGDPTGSKVELGSDETDRGNYDFGGNMRRLQFGVMAGADYYWGRQWGAFLDLSWGLTGIFKSNFHTLDQTLYPIYGTIGLAYRLK